MSSSYLRALARRLLGPTGVGERVRFVLAMRTARELDVPERARVLDAGCGEGLYAFALAKQRPTWQVDAVDVDAEIVGRCRERLARERLGNLSFGQADVVELEVSERYDLVLAVDLLEHVQDHRAALRSLVQALRPGGTILAHVPAAVQHHPFGPSRRALEAELASGNSHHRRPGYVEGELLRDLAETGLAQTTVRHTFGPLLALLWDLDWWLSTGRWRRALRALLFPVTLLAPWLDSAPRRGAGNGMLVVARKP